MVVPPDLEQLISDTLDWLLSLAESGSRLVVVQPCEHGVFNPHYDGGSGLGCPGGSGSVVWPTEEEE
jgi:hypothetical protein